MDEAELQLLAAKKSFGKEFVRLARSISEFKNKEAALLSKLRESLAPTRGANESQKISQPRMK